MAWLRRPLPAVALLFALGLALRLFSVYPPTIRHDPATIALQAFRILDGERPIFWSGQAWMGTAGTYLEALLFRLFGANSLVMSLYAWTLSGIWVLLSLLLAWRLCGPRVAVLAAALWLVPTPALLYWSSQARNDYQVFFIATPLILLLTHDVVLRHRAGRSLDGRALLLGFVSGSCFWQNMAIGPCLVVTFVVLALHLGRAFWTRFAWLYAPAWLAGFSPVIAYNLTAHVALRGQGDILAWPALRLALWQLVTHVWPSFWGMPRAERPPGAWGMLQLFFLAWAAAMFLVYVALAWRKWRRREELLAEQLLLGLAVLQVLVPTVTEHARHFASKGNPILPLTNLYTLAFVMLAVVMLRFSGTPRLLVALPFLIYAGNNVKNTLPVTRTFFSALGERGAAAIHRFPDPRDPLIGFLQREELAHGYFESAKAPETSLAGLHVAEFSSPYRERVLDYALRVDASRDIFWIHHPGLPDGFRMVGAAYEAGPHSVYYRFRRDPGAETLLESTAVTVFPDPAGAPSLTDRRFDSVWRLGSPPPEAWIRFEFQREERVDRITLLPEDYQSLPAHLVVQRSQDGVSWETVDEWPQANVFFWSVRHPFLKTVKPRCELVLSRPEPARYLRLLIPAQPRRGAFREVYLHRADPADATPVSLDEEIGAIQGQLAPLKGSHLVVGDHYFMSFFKLAGHEVEFIPNRSIDNYGRPNPFLSSPLPLDFSRRLALIVPKSHSAAVSRALAESRVPGVRREHARYDVYLTEPAAAGASLYWSGFDLLQLGAVGTVSAR